MVAVRGQILRVLARLEAIERLSPGERRPTMLDLAGGRMEDGGVEGPEVAEACAVEQRRHQEGAGERFGVERRVRRAARR